MRPATPRTAKTSSARRRTTRLAPSGDRWRCMYARRSIERRRIHDSALIPGLVVAAIQFQLRTVAQVALVDLTVVADRLDHVVRPRLAQAELLADTGLRAQQLLYARIGIVLLRLDIGRRDAELLRFDERED